MVLKKGLDLEEVWIVVRHCQRRKTNWCQMLVGFVCAYCLVLGLRTLRFQGGQDQGLFLITSTGGFSHRYFGGLCGGSIPSALPIFFY